MKTESKLPSGTLASDGSPTTPSRRDFARATLGGAVGLVMLGGCLAEEEAPGALTDDLASDPTVGEEEAWANAVCTPQPPTPQCVKSLTNPLGPYYKANAPNRSDLRPAGAPGQVLLISGVVLASDCVTQLADAGFEVWQADANAKYDMATYKFRAALKTDACGRYAFTTVMPGHYLNGSQYRPSHIHIRVKHPQGKTLVTQIYFQGDPYNAIDPFFKSSLMIALTPDTVGGQAVKKGAFNVILGAV